MTEDIKAKYEKLAEFLNENDILPGYPCEPLLSVRWDFGGVTWSRIKSKWVIKE